MKNGAEETKIDSGNPKRWQYGTGEFLIEAPDGKTYRIGEVPEEYRDRAKRYPNEVVIGTDDDLE